MQALILAAGKGKRLADLTKDKTKCMVEVNGKKLIDHCLETITNFELNKIVLVIGYKGDLVKEYLGHSYKGVEIEYVENPVYDTTNNIYSLYLAKEQLAQDDTILIESDLIFEKKIIELLLNTEKDKSVALVEQYKAWMDGTVVEINSKNEIKSFIAKSDYDYQNIENYYKTVNIYKFTKDFSQNHYIPFLEAYCKSAGLDEYYENVLRVITFLDSSSINVLKLEEGEKWYEIDDKQDLNNAETIFSDDIRKYQYRYGGYWRFPNLKDFCYLVNPYFPPKRMTDEFKYFFNTLLADYPSSLNIQNLLAAKMFQVSEKSILVGNGAAELINALMGTFDNEKVGITYPTFHEYPSRCSENIVPFYPTNADFSYGVEDIKELSKKCDTVLLINPDNPSGNFIKKAELVELIDYLNQNNKKIIVDESFVDFSDENDQNSIITDEIINKYSNLIIIKSISKSYGVPGIRLGVMLTSNQEIYTQVRSKISIWNINSYGEFFLQIFGKYEEDYKFASKKIANERDRFYTELEKISFLRPIKSQANYFLCELTDRFTATELTKLLMKEYNILIKDCSEKSAFENKQFVRLAVRDTADNDFLIKALKQL